MIFESLLAPFSSIFEAVAWGNSKKWLKPKTKLPKTSLTKLRLSNSLIRTVCIFCLDGLFINLAVHHKMSKHCSSFNRCKIGRKQFPIFDRFALAPFPIFWEKQKKKIFDLNYCTRKTDGDVYETPLWNKILWEWEGSLPHAFSACVFCSFQRNYFGWPTQTKLLWKLNRIQ